MLSRLYYITSKNQMTQNEFLKTINPFKDKMFRLAKRLLVSTEEAEDATQEVLIKLWSKDNLHKLNSIEAMAMTITKNYCLDVLKSKRASNLSIVHNNFISTEAPLQQSIEDKDSLNWVENIMNNLPEQQKIIMQLREIEEYDYEQIAQMLNMNETAVRVALSRARKTIKEAMTKTNDYGITKN